MSDLALFFISMCAVSIALAFLAGFVIYNILEMLNKKEVIKEYQKELEQEEGKK